MAKLCKKCNIVKPINQFHLNTGNKDLHTAYCKICGNEESKAWQKKNKEKYNAQKRRQFKNPQYAIAQRGRVEIRSIIQNKRPGYKMLNQNGAITREVFMAHMISTIPDGYTIADYGTTLCVDHIIPCCKFDLLNLKEFKKCFHYTNLRLVTKSENLKKGTKLV